ITHQHVFNQFRRRRNGRAHQSQAFDPGAISLLACPQLRAFWVGLVGSEVLASEENLDGLIELAREKEFPLRVGGASLSGGSAATGKFGHGADSADMVLSGEITTALAHQQNHPITFAD